MSTYVCAVSDSSRPLPILGRSPPNTASFLSYGRGALFQQDVPLSTSRPLQVSSQLIPGAGRVAPARDSAPLECLTAAAATNETNRVIGIERWVAAASAELEGAAESTLGDLPRPSRLWGVGEWLWK
jgi:hypothetical protein